MNIRDESIERSMHPLFQAGEGGSTPTSSLFAKQLRFQMCDPALCVRLVRAWHSRLPHCQASPWQFAFCAEYAGTVYAVALWHNPSARCLPSHWIELRRMACAADAPKNTASRFLSWMVRHFKSNHAHRERCISYQDQAVHTGTIYKASGWDAVYTSKPRTRDRTQNRRGTARQYRSNANGETVDSSAKTRWEYQLNKHATR